MDILIAGSSGFIGQELTKKLAENGYHISKLSRDVLYGDLAGLSLKIKNNHVVINLAGANILRRWTEKNKNLIYKSRIETTQNIVKAINLLAAKERPGIFISASAVGIYKPGQRHDEQSTDFNQGFLEYVVKGWEEASSDLPGNIRKVIFRTGLVLGKRSKTIKKMVIPFKLGLGATIGNGKQPFPFIHIDDVIKAFMFGIENKNINGIYNLVAPQTITNTEFTKSYAKTLNRPALLQIPGFIIKMIFGEASTILTESPEVIPKRLIDAGFSFSYPTIEKTLDEIISR